MEKGKKGWLKAVRDLKFYGLVLALFLVITLVSLHILQNELLKNAQQTGTTLAHSYAVDEERNTATYEALLRLGAAHLDRLVEEGAGEEQIHHWLSGFLTDMTAVSQKQIADPYAVVNGNIIAANQWEGDESFDYAGTEWYQKAMEADGDVIYTNAYTDAIYHRSVITVAVKCASGPNILAFDIFPEKFRITRNSMSLPEGGSYFLCDRNGTLLYAQTELTVDRQTMQEYLYDIIGKMEEGLFNSRSSYIYDLDGRQRAVYAAEARNGWLSIITVPYSTILGDLKSFTIGFSAVFLVFIFFTVLVSVRNYRLNRRVEYSGETIQVLGNSYYAIYRVDVERGTYEMVKASDYVKERLGARGEYRDFLDVLAGVIEEKACQEFLTNFSLEHIRELVQGQVRDFGGDFLRKFGDEYRWVNVRLLMDETLKQGEAVLCFREVGKERQAQLRQMELLKNALDKARENEESRAQFFSSMSHDMRTPLNAIIGLAGLAEESVEDAGKTRGYLEKIRSSSRLLLGLINDILELSRLERGKLEFSRETLDLRKWLKECAEPFRMQALKENRDFQLSCEVSDPVVMADPSRLTQIFNNLLSNAFKFTGTDGQVRVSLRQADSRRYANYQLVISDTGRGMSGEYLKKIFEPYEREARFGDNHVPGTGLGMPIVKSIVTQMDGQIKVESEPGQGTTFTVTLPLEVVRNEESLKEMPSEPVSAQEAEGLEGMRILLAEDNELNMEIATEVLTMRGAEVTQAWNGREALEAFSQSEPGFFHVVLMDMQMPEMNGCEAAKAIRALKRADGKTVPILAVTANAFAEDIAATTEAGMNVHISKPIDFDALCRVLLEQTGRVR